MFLEPISAIPGTPDTSQASSGPNYPERRQQAWLLAKAAKPAIQALVLAEPADIRYLTGAHEGIFWLVLGENDLALALTRHMLVNEVACEASGCEILLAGTEYPPPTDNDSFIRAELLRRNLTTAGFLPAKTSVLAHASLASGKLDLLAVPDVVATLRSVKEPWEIELTRHCIEIAEEALAAMIAGGAKAWIGRSEQEIAGELESRMRSLGADRQGFPFTGIIVASGPNSASCHHLPGKRLIKAGAPVLIDWGAELQGYRSDLTRTFFIGSVPDFARVAYPVVMEALERAAATLRAGAPTGDADLAAREIVRNAGFPEFYYGVGHGVGLDIHEGPWLRPNGADCLQANMVTTVEPGIYLTGTGGIRIENIYLIQSHGHERLGALPYGLEDAVIA
jgi:Xaa-Pro aminopeptidase